MLVLLAYAAADGHEPAGRLAELLMSMGVMALDAGSAAPPGTGLIALLTPAALADGGVRAALQRASAEGRPLLPLSVPNPATFPAADDLARILEWRGAASPAAAPAPAAKYQVNTALNSTIGDNAVTVNVFGQAAGWSAAETEALVAALRAQQPGALMSAQELRTLFAGLQAQMQEIEQALRQGFTRVLARFDANEQRFLAPILARLDGQGTEQVAAILDALASRSLSAEELDQHLATIHLALAELNIRLAQMGDRQFAAAVQDATKIADDPMLDVKHKLKVTLPILPAFLAYEGELELSNGLNLTELWRRLRAQLTGRDPRAQP